MGGKGVKKILGLLLAGSLFFSAVSAAWAWDMEEGGAVFEEESFFLEEPQISRDEEGAFLLSEEEPRTFSDGEAPRQLIEGSGNEDRLLLQESLEVSMNEAYESTGKILAGMAEQTVPAIGSTKGEWLILGLARSGWSVASDLYSQYYQGVIDTVKNKQGILHSVKYTEYSRVILALTAIGADVTDVGGYDLLLPLADFDKTIWQGVNGAVFALLAFDSHDYQIPPAPEGAKKQTTREELIRWILSQETVEGGWPISSGGQADIDLTAMAIQALAPYYGVRSDVKEAVDRGLERLASFQSADGDFGTSEACSQVITALASLGIDPSEDGRFFKDGRSLTDVLMDYYVEGGGFRHDKSSGYNQMASEQAFYAMAACFRLREGKTSLYSMTDVPVGSLSPAGGGSQGTESGGDPESGEEISVFFTLLGDSLHDSDSDGKVHTLASGNLTTWIPRTVYHVPGNFSVKDVAEKAMGEFLEDKFSWDNPTGNYFETIYRNGAALGEFTNGKNSGWMYTLNGTHPGLGVKEQQLKDQDEIVFHYTDNYLKEEHEHEWSSVWSFDSTQHWKDCQWDCGERKDLAAHKWGAWKNLSGTKVRRTCSVCGCKDTRKVKAVEFQVKAPAYNKVKVTWTGVPGASGYRVFRRIAGKKSWTRMTDKLITALSWTDDSVTVGTRYEYTVRAFREVSGKLVGDVYDQSGKAVTPSLAAVKLEKAVSKRYDRITVTWKKTAGADSYRVFRKTASSSWKEIKTVSGTSYTDKGLTTGTRYYYTVKACRKVNGKTAVSSRWDKNGISAVPSLSGVSGVSVKTGAGRRSTITWKAAAGADGYQIWCRSGNGKFKLAAEVKGTVRSYIHKGLVKGQKYSYKVRAYRKVRSSVKYGAFSAVKSVTVK